MKAKKEQVEQILRHPGTINAMTRGKSLKSYLFALSREQADEIIDRLERGEDVRVGK